MPTMVVEIHVPLLPTPNLPDGSYPFPWIDEVEDFLSEDQGDVEVFDEGEEDGDVYVFSIAGASQGDLLAVASRVATLPGVPAGTLAVDLPQGRLRRVETRCTLAVDSDAVGGVG